MRTAWALGCIVAGALLSTTPAAAEPAEKMAAALSWVRAPGAEACASLTEVTARVNARLGRAAFVAPLDAKVLIEASIAADSERHAFRVHIVLTSGTGESLGTRDLEVPGDDCREATDTAALALALMIDPDAGSAQSQAAFPVETAKSEPAPETATPAALAPKPAAPRPTTAPEPSKEYWRARLGVGALISAGELPGIAYGALGAVRLMPRSGVAGVDVLARYLAPKDQELRPNVGGTFSSSSVGLGGFWAPVRSPRSVLSVSAGAELASIASNGYNFAQSNQYRRTWLVSAELASELALPLADRFALLLRLGLRLPFVRQEFAAGTEQQTSRIFKTSAMMGDFSLGLAFDP